MAITKVYLDSSGKTVIINNGTASSSVVNVDAFNFDKNDAGEYFILKDANDGWKLKVLASEFANEAGTLVGAYNDVIAYLIGLVPVGVGDIVAGNVETPMTIEDVYVVTTNETGSTPAGVKSFSILFEGTGGALNGVPVVSGYENSKPASLGNALGSESYTIPTTADAAFPFSPRVVISYVIQL